MAQKLSPMEWFQMLQSLGNNMGQAWGQSNFNQDFKQAMQPVEQNQWMPVQQGQVPYSPETIQAGGYNQKSMVPPNILQALASVVQKNPSNAPYAQPIIQQQAQMAQINRAGYEPLSPGVTPGRLTNGSQWEQTAPQNPFRPSNAISANDWSQEYNEDGTPKTMPIPNTNSTRLVQSKTIGDEKKTRLVPGGTKPGGMMIGGGGFKDLSQEQKDKLIDMYIIDKRVPAIASRDAAGRDAWNASLADYMIKNNISGADAVLQKSQQDSYAASLKYQQKVKNMMGSFVKNLDFQVGRLKTFAEKIGRVDARLLNVPIRKAMMMIKGSANESILSMYLTDISNDAAKLSSGSSASIAEISVGGQERWNKIHDPNLAISELIKLVEETQQAAQGRISTAQSEIDETINTMKQFGASKPESNTFELNGESYTIPANEVDEFLKDNPNAKRK